MPSIKGTASVEDARARSKALKATKFPANFAKKIKLDKINKPVLTQWIEQKVTSILGFDDEIVSSTAINLFLPGDGSTPDPRRAQLDLVGFLGEEESASFARDLWTLLVEAQDSPSGIPRTLLEAKKKELSQQRQLDQAGHTSRVPEKNGTATGRSDNSEMNRFVQEAARRAAAVRRLVPEAPNGGNREPIPIPVSPPHVSDQTAEGPRPSRQSQHGRASSQDGDRKMPARRSNSRSRYDRNPRNSTSLFPDSDGRGPTRHRGRGSVDSRSAEYRPPPINRRGPSAEDEFNRTNNWRRDDPPPHPPLPPPPLPDEGRRRGGSTGRGRRRYYSEDEEMEDLERRLITLKKRVSRRGEDYAIDDEIDDIEDRLDELDRRRRHRRREEEEEFRRRGRRDHRSRSRSRSNGPRRPPPGPPPPPPPRRSPPGRRRDPSSESEVGGRRRRRSPSSDSSSSSRSSSSSSVSSRSSKNSHDSSKRGRRGRSLSRSRSRSRSYSDDSRR